METCQRCGSDRIYNIDGKTSDCFCGYFQGKHCDGYVTDNVGIGGGDYIEFGYCLECGQIQGEWPVKDPDFGYEDDEDY